MANNNAPHIFMNGNNPIGLHCNYSRSAQNIINGKPNTFGMLMHREITPLRRGFNLYASDQMMAWEQNVITTISNEYSSCYVTGITIISGMTLLKHIFGGRPLIPRPLGDMYGNELFAIPIINDFQTWQIHGAIWTTFIELFEIWGLALCPNRHLWALYQLAIMNDEGFLESDGNDPQCYAWDCVSVSVSDEEGRRQGRYVLQTHWQYRMVDFIVRNHMFPLNL